MKKDLNILIIEDSATDFKLISEYLRRSDIINFIIAHSNNLQKGKEILKQNNIEAIILDLTLPDSSGLQTFIEIRKAAKHIPILILSASKDNELAFNAIKLGAEDFIVKTNYNLELIERYVYFAIERSDLRNKIIQTNESLRKAQKASLNLLEDLNEEIREKKNAEDALRASEWKFKNLIECSPNGVIIVRNKTIIFTNKAACRILGYPKEELQGMLLEIIFSNKEGKVLIKLIYNMDINASSVINQELKLERKDGQRIWLKIQIIEITYDKENSILMNLVDITKMKETGFQMLQQEKMATFGQLAAGVAHEINNPMGFILSNLRTLRNYFKSIEKFYNDFSKLIYSENEFNIEEAKERINKIKYNALEDDLDYIISDIKNLIPECIEGANRVSKIVQDVKSFSRIDKDEIEKVNINDIIRSTLNIVWNQIKYHCEVDLQLANNVPDNECNPRQLSQAIMNIIINASHAIEERLKSVTDKDNYQGQIIIRTVFNNHKEKRKSFIELTITDNGTGMPESSLRKIFEPFFTTKEEGKGTGLGMSICYEIIDRHYGKIDVKSEENAGTSFVISLPLINQLKSYEQYSKLRTIKS